MAVTNCEMAGAQNITGLILAGGAGLRVGGRDKGLLPWRGRPLIEQVVERLRPQVGKLLISCNRNQQQYAALANTTVIDTRRDFQGPLAGLEAAIPCIDSNFLLISGCDTPLLPADLACRLLTALTAQSDGNVDICYAHDGERDQYLSAMLRSSILPSLTPYLDEGHRTVRHWFHRHRCQVVDFSDRGECFSNYNRLD